MDQLDIKSLISDFKQKETSLWVPDIMEFVLSDQFLGKHIYPRQATELKICFLQDELFTEYDYQVIGEWTQSFTETEDNGIQPDILDRIQICKLEGRPWFREWVNVTGRRAGKGYVGGLAAAYVLWHYICKRNPQAYYGIDQSKQMTMVVFGAKKEMARENLWKDVKNTIIEAPCFAPYISRELGESLTIFAPNDFDRIAARKSKGNAVSNDAFASFTIVPKESTPTAARGLASFVQMYDEMAHVVRQVAKADAGEVWDASTPALDTFGKDAWIYEPSSPYSKTGKFYENWELSLAHSDGTDGFHEGAITRPEMMMTQLESWNPYEDWENANQILVMPTDIYENPTKGPRAGKHPGRKHLDKFTVQTRKLEDGTIEQIPPPQLYDEQMQKLQASNPDTFAVERLAHWASVMDAYLSPDMVERVFAPWPPENPQNLTMKTQGKLSEMYKFHGDPSKSGANFGWAGAHIVYNSGDDFPHVVFDVVSHWSPQDFPTNDYKIDYDFIEEDIKGYINRFTPAELTFDQGYSNWMISRLQKWVRTRNYPRQVNVFEIPATAPRNWTVAETFKTALYLGLVHAPFDDLAKQEMLFLQLVSENKIDKPSAGPVQTKDVFDAMSIVVHSLIGNEIAAFVNQDLSKFQVKGHSQGGFPTQAQQIDNTQKTFNALSGWGNRGAGAYMPARGRSGQSSGSRFGRR